MVFRRWAAALGVLLCLLLCACGAQAETRKDTVTVWCLEDTLYPLLKERIDEYNSQKAEELLPVSLRSFPDEESLAAAFDATRPDLLICGHDRSAALIDGGVLTDIRAGLGETAPDYPAYMTAAQEGLGRSFFLLGTEVTLLYANRETAELSELGDLAALCERSSAYAQEQGKPFFTADAFGALFYQGLLSWNVEFHALPEQDRENGAFTALYNLLAGGAYDGGITVLNQSGAALVQEGLLPCAAVGSRELTTVEETGFAFSPLPGLKQQEELLGRGWGIAVTSPGGRGSRSTVGFLRWLFSEGRSDQLALDAGLVPAAEGAAPQADSDLEELLLAIQRDYRLHLPDPDGDYWKNKNRFEQDFRAALQHFL